MASIDARTGYAPIGALNMYYEIQGSGRPLVVLHGAYMTIDMMGPILSGLAETRQVIAPEQQGHGRTADVDRPLTYEAMGLLPGAHRPSWCASHMRASGGAVAGVASSPAAASSAASAKRPHSASA